MAQSASTRLAQARDAAKSKMHSTGAALGKKAKQVGGKAAPVAGAVRRAVRRPVQTALDMSASMTGYAVKRGPNKVYDRAASHRAYLTGVVRHGTAMESRVRLSEKSLKHAGVPKKHRKRVRQVAYGVSSTLIPYKGIRY